MTVVATYGCPECEENRVELTDYHHRTHVAYSAAGVRCPDCNTEMERLE